MLTGWFDSGLFFTVLFYSAITVQAIMLITALLNARTIRRDRLSVANSSAPCPTAAVSVLIPARNESNNLPRLLASLKRQRYQNAEFLIYDDLSTDNTWEIISAATDSRVKSIRGSDLPEGWVGKVHACHRLAESASGDIMIFLDADTEFLHDYALQCLVVAHQHRKNDTVLTAMPSLRGEGQLLVSVVGHFILALAPWWLQSRLPSSLLAGLNGQCWIIGSELYRRHLPHEAVKNEVLEDVMIGRYLHGLGITPVLTDWQDDLAVYMYSSLSDAWSGFRKNASSMLGPTTVLALFNWSIFTVLFVVAPIYNPVLYIGQILVKAITDRIMRQPPWLSIVVPLSFVLKSLVALDSVFARARGQLRWKGRTIGH